MQLEYTVAKRKNANRGENADQKNVIKEEKLLKEMKKKESRFWI